jgi:hypothetical protein
MSTFREPDLREVVVHLGAEIEALRAENEALRRSHEVLAPDAPPKSIPDRERDAERRRLAEAALARLDALASRDEARAPASTSVHPHASSDEGLIDLKSIAHTGERVDLAKLVADQRTELVRPATTRDLAARQPEGVRRDRRIVAILCCLAGMGVLLGHLGIAGAIGPIDPLGGVLIVIGVVMAGRRA